MEGNKHKIRKILCTECKYYDKGESASQMGNILNKWLEKMRNGSPTITKSDSGQRAVKRRKRSLNQQYRAGESTYVHLLGLEVDYSLWLFLHNQPLNSDLYWLQLNHLKIAIGQNWPTEKMAWSHRPILDHTPLQWPTRNFKNLDGKFSCIRHTVWTWHHAITIFFLHRKIFLVINNRHQHNGGNCE